MMASNGEVTSPSGDCGTFWDNDGFKRTVRRTEDGMNQCGELMKMMQDRAEIEKEYAKKLRGWGKRWAEHVEKGPEYGTTKAMMKNCMESADKLADVHNGIRDKILTGVQVRLKEWKNDHFKKGLVGGCREAKAFEDAFRKAQKPWQKKMAKLTKAKKEYYNACKVEHSATQQDNSSKGTGDAPPPDQVRKAQEKSEKLKKETEAARKKYTQTLLDLNAAHGMYMEAMVDVFEQTQTSEKRRLDFMKTILVEFFNTLDFMQNKSYAEVYNQIRATIDQADSSQDLKWWSTTHGPETASMPLPSFEEYVAEPVAEKVPLSARTPGSSVYNGDAAVAPVVAAAVASAPDRDSIAYRGTGPASADAWSNRPVSSANYGASVKGMSYEYSSVEPPSRRQQVPPQQSYSDDRQNPFDEDDSSTVPVSSRFTSSELPGYTNQSEIRAYGSDLNANPSPTYEEIGAPVQSSSSGVRMRALYDYHAVEADELSLTAGEIFLKIKDVDDQGWCTGLKDGRSGLYPENYAEVC